MRRKSFPLLILPLLLFITNPVPAHCDGVDGPVVLAAKKAIETQNLDHALIWIQAEHEDEVKTAFEKTLKVRTQSQEVQEMADMYFFETFVRLHRLGEGASYTGLKEAGRDLGLAIPAADISIKNESLTELYKLLSDKLHNSLHYYFEKVIDAKNFDTNNVEAGREYVENYVKFMHFVEAIYESSELSDHAGHGQEAKGSSHSH